MYFPDDFLWGTATSAHQVEGNNKNNDWWRWEKKGHIDEKQESGAACNWWKNADQDLDHAAEMGTNAMRVSLEWSRIEPAPSSFDGQAIKRYRELLEGLHNRGIEPMVTLHHFSNPLWLVEKGDFNSELIVDYFQRYCAKVAAELGELIPKWITINEPVVYFLRRYLAKVFPEPEKGGLSGGMEALRNMLRCHAAAYRTIKELQPESLVGVAKNYMLIEPRPGGNLFDRWWAKRVHTLLNDNWMESMVGGRLQWPVGRGKIEGLAGSFDFMGINYYSRFHVPFPPRPGKLLGQMRHEDAILADGDFFELYPEGLFRSIKDNLQYNKPIYITGNGLPDPADRLRPQHLLGHLREVWRAVSFNYPVMGYYHRALTDNFEWDRGWSQRFGLIEMDPKTQERKWRPSANLYQEICQSNSISSGMAESYAPELLEKLFPGKAPAELEG